MSVNLSPIGGAAAQFFDNNGNPLAGGKLYTYAAGTTTPLATYTTDVGDVAHTNPIILDSAGRVPGGQIWLTDGSVGYKFLLETSFSVLVGTFDNIPPAISGSAADIEYLPAGTGAVATTVQGKLRESVSMFDFLTAALITAVQTNTYTAQQITDVTTAIQTAIADTNITALFFPKGTYKIGTSLNIQRSSLRLHGESMMGTSLVAANASVGTVINIGVVPAQANYYQFLKIENMVISAAGSSYCIYGYYAHTSVDSCYITGAAIAAVAQVGWCNTYSRSLIINNTGDGFQTIGFDNYSGNLIIRDTRIFLNDGWGFFAVSSNISQIITGSLFETNKKGGIYCWGSDYEITGCYFESNAQNGYTFTSPASINIKADIIVNGSATATTIGAAYTAVATITGNFSNCADVDSFIFAPGASAGLVVENNNLNGVKTVVRLYGWSTSEGGWGNLGKARIGYNGPTATPALHIDVLSAGAISGVATDSINIVGVPDLNIAEQDMNRWGLIASDNGGSWQRSSVLFDSNPLIPVWELLWETANSSHFFGFSIDAALYPAFHNKFIAFGVNIKNSAANVGNNLYVASVDMGTQYPTDWVYQAGIFKFPTTGNITFSVRKTVAAGSIYVTRPVLFEMGADVSVLQGRYQNQTSFLGTAAPTIGTWKRGDIVWDVDAAAGAAPGFYCVTAGTPGTWKAMAALAA